MALPELQALGTRGDHDPVPPLPRGARGVSPGRCRECHPSGPKYRAEGGRGDPPAAPGARVRARLEAALDIVTGILVLAGLGVLLILALAL